MKKFSLKRAAAAGMAVLTAAAVMTGCGDSGNKEEGGKSKVDRKSTRLNSSHIH